LDGLPDLYRSVCGGSHGVAAVAAFRGPAGCRRARRPSGVGSLSSDVGVMPALIYEDRKSETATIAGEALKVVPEADRQIVGRRLGGAIAKLAAAAEDVSQWVRIVASAPRQAVEFVTRGFDRWRRMPPERRALPSPKLLLEVAAGYATVNEDELKTGYEQLLRVRSMSTTPLGSTLLSRQCSGR
jgi:hypothetical protein